MTDATALENPNPKPEVPVSKNGDSTKLGVHLFERLKAGPRGPVLDLVSVGPIAVGNAVRGVVEANTRLARYGLYLSMIPAIKRVARKQSRDEKYGDSVATVLVLVLQDMD